MKKNSSSRGISLIVLIVTIIVIIILAGTVILSLSQNNAITQANEAVFKNDIANIQDQINLFSSNQYIQTLGAYDISQMNGQLSDFAPSITKYDEELKVINGKLAYIGTDDTKAKVALELNIIPELVTVAGVTFNRPNIEYLPEATTKAIKWNSSNVESEINLSVAKTDTSWYDYSTQKWANIKTSNNDNYAYWTWIPRFAYKKNYPYVEGEQVFIKFLAGNSNIPADGTSLDGYYVSSCFSFDGKQLSGIWVAKYEASSSNPNKYDGGYTGGGNDISLHVRVLPDVYSWRKITTGNTQTVSMNMTSSIGSVGTTEKLDTHLIKENEWFAVCALSQSEYGEKPWKNPFGDNISGSYKYKTGYSGEIDNSPTLAEGNTQLYPYNDLTYGGKSSTTGNIFGVYDMLGGSYEYLASLLDRESNYMSNGKLEHIQNKKIRPEYVKYYDIYKMPTINSTGVTWMITDGEYDFDFISNVSYSSYSSGSFSNSFSFRPILICGYDF